MTEEEFFTYEAEHKFLLDER